MDAITTMSNLKKDTNNTDHKSSNETAQNKSQPKEAAQQVETSGPQKEKVDDLVDRWRQEIRNHESWAKLTQLAETCLQVFPEDACKNRGTSGGKTCSEKMYRKMKKYKSQYKRYKHKLHHSETREAKPEEEE